MSSTSSDDEIMADLEQFAHRWDDQPDPIRAGDGLLEWMNDLERTSRRAEEPERFTRYDAAMASPHWKQIRQTALMLARHRCQECQSAARLHVHHVTYERLGCERLDDLKVLCRGCHAAEHAKTLLHFEGDEP